MFKKLFTWLVRLTLLLWFVMTIVVGMWLWQENSTSVNVSYFGFIFSGQTLGTVMTIMLLVGFGLGSLPLVVMALFRDALFKRRINKVHKTYEKQRVNEQRVTNVKSLPNDAQHVTEAKE